MQKRKGVILEALHCSPIKSTCLPRAAPTLQGQLGPLPHPCGFCTAKSAANEVADKNSTRILCHSSHSYRPLSFQ